MPTPKRKNIQDLTLIQLRKIKKNHATLRGRVAELEATVRILVQTVFPAGKVPRKR